MSCLKLIWTTKSPQQRSKTLRCSILSLPNKEIMQKPSSPFPQRVLLQAKTCRLVLILRSQSLKSTKVNKTQKPMTLQLITADLFPVMKSRMPSMSMPASQGPIRPTQQQDSDKSMNVPPLIDMKRAPIAP